MLEEIAQAAQRATRAHFGTSVQLFTPLYLANYCANVCTYCGFSANNRIRRSRLTPEALDAELRAIADRGELVPADTAWLAELTGALRAP